MLACLRLASAALHTCSARRRGHPGDGSGRGGGSGPSAPLLEPLACSIGSLFIELRCTVITSLLHPASKRSRVPHACLWIYSYTYLYVLMHERFAQGC